MLFRYPSTTGASTTRDPFEDAVDFIGFLTAKDYLIDLLENRHSVSRADAVSRCNPIIQHVRVALAFLEQAAVGPIDVSYLPAYYAILNLLKVCVLCGPHHKAMLQQRTHGVSYKPVGKESRNILTEELTIHSEGAIPLAYRTITDCTIPSSSRGLRRIRLSDILPFIADIAYEFARASPQPRRLITVELVHGEVEGKPAPKIVASIGNMPPPLPIRLNQLQVLKGFKRVPGSDREFIGSPAPNGDVDEGLRRQTRRFLLYHPLARPLGAMVLTPLSSSRLYLPEELPIALLFFYMSSVVRYRPEWVSRLRDSRYWPVVASARRHALYKFLLVFLSFVHQETITFTRV